MRGRNFLVPTLLLIINLPTSIAQRQVLRDCDGFPQNFPPSENYTRICVPEWAFNRTYSASTTAPIARALNSLDKDGGTAVALGSIIAHFEREYMRLATLFRSEAATPLREQFRKRPEATCNIPKRDSPISAVSVKISEHGWGVFSEALDEKNLCTTQLNGGTEVVRNAPLKEMRRFLKDLQAAAGSVMEQSGYRWANPRTFMNFSYLAAPTRCELLHFTAFRVRGKWGVNTGYTNDWAQDFLPDYEREYLVEQLTLTNGSVGTIPMTIRQEPTADNPYNRSEPFVTPFVRDTSTLIMRWGGVPVTSLFKSTLNPANNPAIRAAMAMVAERVEQIEGSSTVSEIAILIAPIALTALPVALFADVNTHAIVTYTIATDVLTVLPLLIKGIELLSFGTDKTEAVVTWFYGGRNDINNVLGAESWYASCTATKHVRILGSIFICVAISSMIFGVAFEIIAKRYTDRRRENTPGAGMEQMPMWKGRNTVVCRHCNGTRSLSVP